jgi:hypothetical protein
MNWTCLKSDSPLRFPTNLTRRHLLSKMLAYSCDMNSSESLSNPGPATAPLYLVPNTVESGKTLYNKDTTLLITSILGCIH